MSSNFMLYVLLPVRFVLLLFRPLQSSYLGSNGSCAYTRRIKAKEPAFKVDSIENTGAGDTFFGCALNYILEHDFSALTQENLSELLRFANAGAALITTRKGALKVMPEKEEIYKMIKK